MLALATSTLGKLTPPPEAKTTQQPCLVRLPIQAFIQSLMPALDFAFPLENAAALPEDMATSVEQLHRGPLGNRSSSSDHQEGVHHAEGNVRALLEIAV